MERENISNSIEFSNQHKVKQAVENNFGFIIKFLVNNESNFPRCCQRASHLLHFLIQKETGLNTKICEGIRHDIPKNENCSSHVWLEYNDLIIDPTDFQFEAINLWSLPLIPENLIPENQSFEGLSEDQIDQIFMDNYVQKATKRYLENPNEKENHFLKLTESLKTNQLSPTDFIIELKQNFGCKIFYSKSDSNYIYQPK